MRSGSFGEEPSRARFVSSVSFCVILCHLLVDMENWRVQRVFGCSVQTGDPFCNEPVRAPNWLTANAKHQSARRSLRPAVNPHPVEGCATLGVHSAMSRLALWPKPFAPGPHRRATSRHDAYGKPGKTLRLSGWERSVC